MASSLPLPDGTTVTIREGETPADTWARAQQMYPEAFAPAQQTQPTAPKKESLAADLGYSALGGIGNLVAFPGQAYGLATGDMDNRLSKAGKSIADYAKSQQSEGFKARQAKQQAAIAEASKEGFLSEAGTAITSTLKDPVLLGNFLAENIPNLIPGFGISRGTMGVGMRMAAKEIAAQGLEGEARSLALQTAQDALVKKATAASVGITAVQQGADVGSQAYEDIYKKLIAQKVPPEQAANKALSLAQAAGLSGAAISYLSTRLPGARALEESFAGAKGVKAASTGAIKGLLGEGVSEGVEEGGGAFARNVAMSTIDPTQNLMQGVGTAAGQGALLGGVLGGAAGMRNSSREAAAQSQAQTIDRQREAAERVDALRQTAEGAVNKLQDPAYLDALYAQAQAVATKRQQLTDAAKGDPADKNPLAQVERKNAREALAAFEKSDEVKALYAELGPAAPLIRQRQAELRKQAAAPAPTVSTPAPFTMQGATQSSMIPETGGVDTQAAQRAAGETERAQYGAGPQVTGYAPDGSPIFARAAAGEDRYGQLMAGLRQLGAADGPDGKKIPGLLQDYQKQAMAATDPADVAKYSQLYNDTLAQTRAMYDEINQLYAEQNRRATAPKLTPLANENVKLTTALDAAKKSGDMAAVQSAAEALQKNIAAGGKNELAAYTQQQAAFAQTQAYNTAQKAKQRGAQPMPTMDLFGSESATSFDERVTQPEAARVAERNAPTGPTTAEESGEPEAMAIAAAQRDADAAAARLQALTATAAKARADFAAGERGPEATDNRGTVQADMFAEPAGTVRQRGGVTSIKELEGDLRDALRQKDITQPGTPEHTDALSVIKTVQAALVNRPATSIRTASDAMRLAETGIIISAPEAATGVQGGQRAGAATLQSLQQQIDRLPTDLHPDDAALVSRIQDKLHLIANRKEEAEPVRDWLYRLSSGPQQVLSSTDGPLKYRRPTYRDAKRGLDFATQDVQNILDNWDQSGRSELETAETQESKVAGNAFAKRKDDRTNFLQQRIVNLQEFVLGAAGKKYAKLYSNVLTAMRRETAAAERLANIDQRIQATEQLLKTAPSKEALVAHQRFIKARWNEHARTEAELNAAQETKRMARIQLYAFSEGVDPARPAFEQLEKYRAELGQLTQTTGPKAVTTTRQGGAQSDLFRSKDVDAGVFDTPAEFNAFMAGQGLQEYRKALSLGGITAQRAQELIAPLDARIAHMQKAIVTEYAAEKARNANNALTQAQLEAARTAAQFRLDRIANSIANQVLAHQKVLDAATKNVAEITNASQYVDKLLADNAKLFGDGKTAFATAMDKLVKAEKELENATANKTVPEKIATLQSNVDALRVTVNGYLENGPAELSQFVERLEELEYRRNKLADKLQAVQATYEQARTDLLAATDSVSAVYGTERQTSTTALAASQNGIDRLRADEAQRLVNAGEAKAAQQLLHNVQVPLTQAQLEAQRQEILSSVSNRTVYGLKTAAVPTQRAQDERSNAARQAEQSRLEVSTPGATISFEGHRRLVIAYEKATGEAAAYRKVLARLQEREAAGEVAPTMAVKGETEPMTLASAEASLNRSVRRAERINKLLDREGETEKAQLEKDVVSAQEKADKWQKAVVAARGALSAATRKANKEATPENVAAQAAAVKARDNAVKQSGIWNTALGDALAARNRGPGMSGMERTPLNQEAAPQEYTGEYEPQNAYEAELMESGRLRQRRETVATRTVSSAAGSGFRTGSEESRGTIYNNQVQPDGSTERVLVREGVYQDVVMPDGSRKRVQVGPRENPRNPITETGSIKTTKAPFGVTEVDESNRTAEQLVQQEAQDVLAGKTAEGSPEGRAYADASRAFNLATSEVNFATDAVQRAEDDLQDARANPSKDPNALKPVDYARELSRTQSILDDAEKKYAAAEDAKETAAVKLRQQKSAAEGGKSRLIADDVVADYALTETGKLKVPKMGPGLRTKNVRLAETRRAAAAEDIYAQTDEELYSDENDNDLLRGTSGPNDNDFNNDLLRGTSGPNDTPLGIGAIRALNSDNLRGALAQVAANSKNPIARRLAAQYATLIGDVRVLLVEEMPGNNPDAPGGITRDGLNIFLNRNTGLSEESLLHEVAHALTIHQLDVPERMLTPDQRAAKRELEAMHEAIKQATELDNDVVKQDDLKEFVAESYGSNQVQQYMRGRQWQDPNAPKLSKPQAMWAAIKSAFMRVIGAKVPPKGTPMHDRFMELADKFLRTPEKGDVAMRERAEAQTQPEGMLYRDPLTAVLNKGFSGKPSVRQVYADNKTNIVLAARQNVADQRAALREVTSLIGTREEKADMALTITMLDSTTSGTMATLAHGALRLNAKGQLEAGTNTSFSAVLDEIGKFPGIKGEQALNLFHIQRVADRANAIPGGWRILAGKDAAARQADAKLVSDKINSDPALKAAVDRANTVYNEFNRGKLELLRDTHALAADDIAKMLKDKNYVPYYRQNGDTINLIMPDGQPRSVGDIRTNPLLRSLKGGDENLLGFVDGEVKNAHLLTRLAIENLGKQKVATRLVELGKTRTTRLVGKPSMIVRPGTGAPEANKIEFRVESTGPKDDGMRHLVVNTEGTIAEGIPSTLVTQAMAGAYTNHNMLTDISNAMSGLLRSAVTRFPLYTLRQLFREPFAASVQGNVRSNPAMAVVKSIWEYGKIMAGTSAEAKLLESYGVVESQVFGGTHDLSKVAKQITGGGTWWTDRVAMWLDKSALAADAATRTQAFKDVLAKGGSQTEALLQAREMQNFSRHGSAAWVQLLGHSIPFFNSSIQSLDNLLRSASGKMPNEELMNTKRTFALRAAGMMAVAAMYYAQMDDDEEWRKLSLRDKISYIHLPIWMGGDRMRLPAPFEVGMLFFSLPMAIMEHVKYGLTAEDWKIVGGAILGQTPGGGSLIPQIAKLPRDLISNYNSFTGQPITPRSKEGLSPEAQFGPGTSQAARRAGELTGVSPFKIDYAMGQLVGQWAKIAGSVTESLFQKASEEGIEKPSTTMADNPIYGSLFQNTRSNADVEHVYAAAAETKEAKATFDSLRKRGLVKDAQQFMEANRQAIALAPYMQKFVAELGNLNVMEERIRNMSADTMSPDVKKARIDILTERKQAIAKQYATMLKRLETK